jgi:uncharacterized membrane protein YkvA (DUF1232 family)
MKPLTQRARIIVPPNAPGKAISIDEFIESESATMDSSKLRTLRGLTEKLLLKTKLDQARSHYDFVDGVAALVRFLESDEAATAADPLPRHCAEAAVAGYYILKGADIIPDSVPEIGLTDDARILARVFERNLNLLGNSNPR